MRRTRSKVAWGESAAKREARKKRKDGGDERAEPTSAW